MYVDVFAYYKPLQSALWYALLVLENATLAFVYSYVYLGSDLLGNYEGAETTWDPADACFKTSVRQELFAILKLNSK
jgi:hypothetical protein